MAIKDHQWKTASINELDFWLSSHQEPTCELDKIGRNYNCDKCNTQTAIINGNEVFIPGHNYTKIYENIFKEKRNDKVKMLEIGMGCYPTNGHSLRMWCDYFSDLEIHVVDINEKNFDCSFYYDNSKVFFHILDQSKEEDLIRLTEKFELNTFDYIIDDGSHIASDQMMSLKILFNNLLKDQGIYFIEDLHDHSFMNYLPDLFKNLNNDHLLCSDNSSNYSLNVSSMHFHRSLLYLVKGNKITR